VELDEAGTLVLPLLEVYDFAELSVLDMRFTSCLPALSRFRQGA